MSDRRGADRLIGGLGPLFPGIRTVMADAGHESRKLARHLMWQGWLEARHCETWSARIQDHRPDLDCGEDLRLARPQSPFQQRLRIHGADFGDFDRHRNPAPYAQPTRARLILLKNPLSSDVS